ncbi:MAG: hypothetical protein IT349_13500 [Candidatus Eisenbacteria bacterium]|nr:hypothetical protein [Candidatus Eisenbacteria bacterium]
MAPSDPPTQGSAVPGLGSVPLWRRLAPLGGMAVGGVYLAAALIKGLDPGLFVQQVRDYQILPSALAPAAAYGFLVIEGLLGLALLLRVWTRGALLLGAALMLLFIGATGWAWAHGNASSCGCFGRLASRGPGAVILEDALFVALLALSWAGYRPAVPPSWRVRLALGLSPLALLYPWVGPRLPLDSVATGVGPETSLADLAADDLKFPLDQGRVLVALVGKDCPRCDLALPGLGAIAGLEGGPRVTAIFAGDRKEKFEWRNEHVPPFPVAHAPAKTLRQYHRKLPVIFLLDGGKVQKVWWRGVPAPSDL